MREVTIASHSADMDWVSTQEAPKGKPVMRLPGTRKLVFKLTVRNAAGAAVSPGTMTVDIFDVIGAYDVADGVNSGAKFNDRPGAILQDVSPGRGIVEADIEEGVPAHVRLGAFSGTPGTGGITLQVWGSAFGEAG